MSAHILLHLLNELGKRDKIVSEYDQEIPHSQSADKTVAS